MTTAKGRRLGSSASEVATDAPHLSVVIPVFNSEQIVAKTVASLIEDLLTLGHGFEIVLVNDGSRDDSWSVIRDLALRDDRIVAIDMLRNYGQHQANLVGLKHTLGEWIVTMDDDGQNPSTEIVKLLEAAELGKHDVVFGQFEQKKSSLTRQIGTRLVGSVNRLVFGRPKGLVVSNFRLIHRSVVDRIAKDPNDHPYMTGQALLYSRHPGNVLVRHAERDSGTSNYSILRIMRLMATIILSFSAAPMHAIAVIGGLVATGSIGLSAYVVVSSLANDSAPPGWTSIIVAMSTLNGVLILMVAMLGAVQMRTYQQLNGQNQSRVHQVVGRDE